jgi:hypothetical protein
MSIIKIYCHKIVNYLQEKKDELRVEWLGADSWIWIVPVVFILFFAIPMLDLGWISSSFEIESLLGKVKDITTQSTALIGLSFTIVGFIMANLAHKDNYIYKILFKKTLFFPTLYLGVSVITSFIIFSSVCEKMPYNEVATTLLIGTILILVFIFLLGRMFRFLGIFISRHNISRIVKKEFRKELASVENANIMIWSREYFELKEGTYTHFQSLMHIRNTIFNSIENKNIDILRDYLDIILDSYEYEQTCWSKENRKPFLQLLNTYIIPEYIEHSIKESILRNSHSNLELLKDFILRLEGLGIYGKDAKIIEPYYEKSLELFSYYYSCYEKYQTNYKIESEIEVMCKESAINYVIGSYKHIYDLDNNEAIKIYCTEVQYLFYTFIKYNNDSIFDEGMQELINQIGWRINDYCSITEIDDWINGQGEWSDKYKNRFYVRNLFFRLKYWLYYLNYVSNQPIDKSLLLNYEESINKVFPNENHRLWEFVLMCATQLYSCGKWDYRYIKAGKGYSPVNDLDWLTQGFAHFLVRNNKVQSINLNSKICFGLQNLLESSWSIQSMQHIIIEVENKILQELYLQNRQDIQPIIEERFKQITACLENYIEDSQPVEEEQHTI